MNAIDRAKEEFSIQAENLQAKAVLLESYVNGFSTLTVEELREKLEALAVDMGMQASLMKGIARGL